MTSSISTAPNLSEQIASAKDTVPSLDEAGNTASKRSVRLLIAHEDPTQAHKTKSVFKDAGWITHAHRITSIEDLDESLKNDDWNIIIAYSNSKLYMPAVIGNYIEKQGAQVHAIFLDETYTPTNAIQIVQCGFKDYLTIAEEERLLFAAAREIDSQNAHRIAAQANEILAEANARSQLLMDTTTDAIAYVTDGMIVHANSVFAQQLQFDTADELDYFPFIDLIAPKDQIVLRPLLRKYQLGEENESHVNAEALTANGDLFKVELNLAVASYEGEQCTQVILRPTVTAETADGDASANSTHNSADFDIAKLRKIDGKGSLFFASIASNAIQRKKLGLRNHLQLIREISSVIREVVPDEAEVFDYLKESWVIVIPNSYSHEPEAFATKLCELVSERSIEEENKSFNASIAVGVSKYGVADMTIEAALNRAFKASAEKQLDGDSGYKVYVPKIDNAAGAAALQSALELNRFRLKYQPIIALQDQTVHFYEAVLYKENDSGVDENADQLIESLGIEKTNAELDRWIISEALHALKEKIAANPNVHLTIPLTASAVMDDDFYTWVSDTINSSGLSRSDVSFALKAADVMDYEKHAKNLVIKLKDGGHKVCLIKASIEHLDLIKLYRPDYTKLASELTRKMNGEDADPDLIKDMINKSQEQQTVCIACDVDSAGELAQLWQTGVPYIQGNYLQAPLATMDYEFSDIA